MPEQKYRVIRTFRDKVTLTPYSIGDFYSSAEQERIEFLRNQGFLGDPVGEAAEGEGDGLKSLGAGYYELPNGDKVRGKEKAEEALKALKEPSGVDADGNAGQAEKDA